MKTQPPSKYPWKSSREPLGFANPRLRTTGLGANHGQIDRRLPPQFVKLLIEKYFYVFFIKIPT